MAPSWTSMPLSGHWARNARVSWGCMPYQDVILYPTPVEVKVLLGIAMTGLILEPDATHSDLKHADTVLADTVWDEEGQWYE